MKMPPRFAVLGLFAAFASVASAQRTFTSQYSFGDSLSDNGNLYALTGRTQPPSPPYSNGHFSNGPTFIELLGNAMLPAATISAKRGNLDFAFGGATAGPGSPVPNLQAQIGMYQLQGLPATSTDLFTVLAGANDMIAVLSAPTTPANPQALDVAGVNAGNAVATNVGLLVAAGAKNIVVAGLPNLGATPRSLASGGPGGAGATFGLRASSAFNVQLQSRLQALASASPDVNFTYVDLQGILDRVVQDYRILGYNNVSSYYLAPAAAGGGQGDPNGYVFFDDIHPTAKTHALLAAIVLEELNPEPVLGWAATEGSTALALESLAQSAIQTRLLQIAKSQRTTGRADAYVAFNYGDGERAVDGFRPGFDYTGQVVTAGVDLHLSDGVFVGGAVNLGRMNSKVSGGRGNFTMEDAGARLYALWRGGPVSLGLDADYGMLDTKGIHRTTAFGGFQTNGKNSGTHWGVGATAMWNIELGTGWALRPLAGLRTERVKLEAYTEKDVPAVAMDFADQEARTSEGFAGVEAGTMGKIAGRDTHFDFRATWHGDLGSHDRDVTGRLANNFTRPTTITVDDGDGTGVELGVAFTFMCAKNCSISLGYAGDIRNGEKLSNRATLSFQTGF